MFKPLVVRSLLRKYTVRFTDLAADPLVDHVQTGDVIVIDKRVADLYPVLTQTPAKQCHVHAVEASERLKEYGGLAPLLDKLIRTGFRKNNSLIAVGGGVVQDVVAFMASILFRGVEWRFYPTTLLAQCDSCIGGKTSINFREFKNQIGNFCPPSEIFIDIGLLKSLPPSEIRSGLGEMIHYFLVSGEADCALIEREHDRAFTNPPTLATLIHRSLMIKKSVIEIDEFDKKERRVFNYGHTFGHAIETMTNYTIPHGIAISMGMELANRISVHLGHLSAGEYNRMRAILRRNVAGDILPALSPDQYEQVLRKDKKNVGSQINAILSKGIGNMFFSPLNMDDGVRGIIRKFISGGNVFDA